MEAIGARIKENSRPQTKFVVEGEGIVNSATGEKPILAKIWYNDVGYKIFAQVLASHADDPHLLGDLSEVSIQEVEEISPTTFKEDANQTDADMEETYVARLMVQAMG